MSPTGDPKLTAELNELLGRELGRNEYGESVFSWRWSEDLFWPATKTGRMITTEQEIMIPIVGGGEELTVGQEVTPEYKRDRQTRERDCWMVAKWMTPEELIVGGLIGHGMGWQGGHKPSHEALVSTWARLYPGMDFPAKGWRVPTDARLPRGPYDPTTPNRPDTDHFIHRVKDQTSMRFDARLQDMLDQDDAKNRREELAIGEECRDSFTAFLNPNPGKRSSFVSMPWSKQDRGR